MSAEPECLSTTARVRALVAAILELGFLRMVTAVKEFTPHKLRFTNSAL